jgi:hypothetical protein
LQLRARRLCQHRWKRVPPVLALPQHIVGISCFARGFSTDHRCLPEYSNNLAKSEFHFGSLKLREADFAGVLAITKRRNSATPVICRTAKLIGSDHLTHARRRTLKGLVPYFGEPSRRGRCVCHTQRPLFARPEINGSPAVGGGGPSKSEIINKPSCLLLE